MATARARFQAHVDGLLSGDFATNVAWTIGPGAVGERLVLTLLAGNTTITAPTGATLTVVVPSPNETNTITVKGVVGDTGIVMVAGEPFVLAPGTAAVVLTTSATVRVEVVYI